MAPEVFGPESNVICVLSNVDFSESFWEGTRGIAAAGFSDICNKVSTFTNRFKKLLQDSNAQATSGKDIGYVRSEVFGPSQ